MFNPDGTRSLVRYNFANPSDVHRYFKDSPILIPNRAVAEFENNPYLWEYNNLQPFAMEEVPGLNRTMLYESAGDKMHMGHFPAGPILDNKGFIIGNKVHRNGKVYDSYADVMKDEMAEIPHGGAIGFSEIYDTSTSSTPMIWL